jgi:enoyl-CoA hydratase/carnithine racemase
MWPFKDGRGASVTYQFVRYEKRERIAMVTIDRPEVMNALHPPADEELSRIWDDFEEDDQLWIAILTGTGTKAFCAGRDLKWTAEHPESLWMPTWVRGGFGGVTERHDLVKPIIAAVNGYALGGGLEMALACDIIVASEDAEFGLPDPRVGSFAGAGGIYRLPYHLPLKIAAGMILTGKPMRGDEALRFGLVNEVVRPDELLSAAERWAQEILECAPLAVRASKEMVYRGLGRPLEDAFSRRYMWQQRAAFSQDHLEGAQAFAERRKPEWTGR